MLKPLAGFALWLSACGQPQGAAAHGAANEHPIILALACSFWVLDPTHMSPQSRTVKAAGKAAGATSRWTQQFTSINVTICCMNRLCAGQAGGDFGVHRGEIWDGPGIQQAAEAHAHAEAPVSHAVQYSTVP